MSEPVQLRCCKFVAMEIAVALTETVSCLSNSGIDVRTSRSLFLFFLLSCARSRRPARRRANSGAFSIFGFSRGPPWAKRGPSGPLSPPDGPCPCPWGFWRARPVEGRPTGRRGDSASELISNTETLSSSSDESSPSSGSRAPEGPASAMAKSQTPSSMDTHRETNPRNKVLSTTLTSGLDGTPNKQLPVATSAASGFRVAKRPIPRRGGGTRTRSLASRLVRHSWMGTARKQPPPV